MAMTNLMLEGNLELLTLNEAAQALRLTVSTLRQWRLNKRFPFVKVGGRVMVRRKDIADFIEANLIQAEAD
jgi:excisionase family DNA binding protein